MENNEFPKYQITWMKGELNLTFRDDKDWQSIMSDLKKAILEWEKWVGSRGTKSAQKPTSNVKGEVVGKCPDCGEELVYRTGYNEEKDINWQANMCSKKCGYVKWL